MKYAIAALIILIVIFILIIYLMKILANKTSIAKEITKEEQTIKEKPNTNHNPSFNVDLLDYNKAKNNIYKSDINDIVSFKKNDNNRIKVFNKTKYIGLIAIKDCKSFSLIQTNPQYFEGKIISKPDFNNNLKKVTIKIQVKEHYSKNVFLINNEYLNKLITLNTLFEVGQIIETSYGPSTITEILNDHLIVEVPSLGKREIYDIKEIIN